MAVQATWTELLDLPGLEKQDKHKFKVDLWNYLDARFLGLTQVNMLTDKQIREIANDFMFDEEGQTIWEPAQHGLWNFAKYDLNDIQAGIAAILFRLIEEHDPTTDSTIVSDADTYNTIKTPSKRSQHETPSPNKRKKHISQKTPSTNPRVGAADPSNVQRGTLTTSPLTPSKKFRVTVAEDVDKVIEEDNTSTVNVLRGNQPPRNLREDTFDSTISIPHDPPPRVTANETSSRNMPQSFTSANAPTNPASIVGSGISKSDSTTVAAKVINKSIGNEPTQTAVRQISNTHGRASPMGTLATPSSDGENQAKSRPPEQLPPFSRLKTQSSDINQLAQTSFRLRNRIYTVGNLSKIPSTVIDYLNECRNAHLLSASACQDESKQQWHHSMAQHVIQLKDDLESRFDSLAAPWPLGSTQLAVSNNFLRNAQLYDRTAKESTEFALQKST